MDAIKNPFSPGAREMAFTVPLFDEFMLRAMPDLEKLL